MLLQVFHWSGLVFRHQIYSAKRSVSHREHAPSPILFPWVVHAPHASDGVELAEGLTKSRAVRAGSLGCHGSTAVPYRLHHQGGAQSSVRTTILLAHGEVGNWRARNYGDEARLQKAGLGLDEGKIGQFLGHPPIIVTKFKIFNVRTSVS